MCEILKGQKRLYTDILGLKIKKPKTLALSGHPVCWDEFFFLQTYFTYSNDNNDDSC